jgi:hypothetical protein
MARCHLERPVHTANRWGCEGAGSGGWYRAIMTQAARLIAAFVLPLIMHSSAKTTSDPPPVRVSILAGQSNMEGHGQIHSLDVLGESSDGAPLLKDIRTEFTDVTVIWEARSPRSGPLRPGWGMTSNEVGPKLGFGAVMTNRYAGPVVLIKTAYRGGKDVFCDFRSPSAGEPVGDEAMPLEKEQAAGNRRVGGENDRLMIEEIRTALADLPELVPGYAGAPVILAGFAWFQGWNDFCR